MQASTVKRTSHSSALPHCHSIHAVMDRETLRRICKDTRGCYVSPELNDKLYLNGQNFARIQGLEEFVNVKALWLQSNALSKIEGLSHLSNTLKVLHLHSNRINSLAGLEALVNLDTLNVSTNILQNLAGVSHLQNLSNLYVSRNLIREASDVAELCCCTKLSVLDLSENKIEDVCIMDDVLVKLAATLRVLYLNCNPVCSLLLPFRKRIISKLGSLTCLDGLPIELQVVERRCCEAWAVGGRDAELAEREVVRQEVRERAQRDRAALRRTLAEGRARRAIREGGDEEKDRIEREYGHALEPVVMDSIQPGDECTVCQQEFELGADAFRLPCLHTYHPSCILRWLGHSSSCPMCRMDLSRPADSCRMDDSLRALSDEVSYATIAEGHNETDPFAHGRGVEEGGVAVASGAGVEHEGSRHFWQGTKHQSREAASELAAAESGSHRNAVIAASARDVVGLHSIGQGLEDCEEEDCGAAGQESVLPDASMLLAETALVRAVREALFDWDVAAARLSTAKVRLSAEACRQRYVQVSETWRIVPSQIMY